MKKRSEFAIYNKCVADYLAHHSNLVEIVKNADLTKSERTLLEARIEIRKKDYESARDILSKPFSTGEVFLLAERAAILSNVYFNISKYEEALVENLQAINFYGEVSDEQGLFMSHYNASADYNRMYKEELSFYYLNEAAKHCHTDKNRGLLERGYACYYQRIKNFEKASEHLRKWLELINKMNVQDQLISKTIALDICFQIKDYKLCEDILDELINIKINRERSRFLLYRNIIKAMQTGKKVSEQTLIQLTDSREYSLRYQIICCLETGEQSKAINLIKELNKICGPIISESFELLNSYERDGIWGSYVETLVAEKIVLENKFKVDSKAWRLLEALQQSALPVSKSELFEFIYDSSYEIESEAKLYKLIERVKKEIPVSIVNRKGAYFLSH